MGQGEPIKPSADAAGIGKETLRRWMTHFTDAVNQDLKPIYMPAKPWSESELAQVRGNFASRRGISNVALACDGSHIPSPFHPICPRKEAVDYRNYKGWNYILAVAFVDSYYRFFDLDVGAPGKAGDNSVLKYNWLMEEIGKAPDRWLGKHGVVLGDSGASDKDGFFLNPYHAPTTPNRCWFNFCHSSTRLYRRGDLWEMEEQMALPHEPGACQAQISHKYDLCLRNSPQLLSCTSPQSYGSRRHLLSHLC